MDTVNTFNNDIENEVFNKLKEILTELIGEDEAEIIGISRDSSFLLDLMVDSIQIVAFIERARALYGDTVNYVAWFSTKSPNQFFDITVGEISGFIADELSSLQQAEQYKQAQ